MKPSACEPPLSDRPVVVGIGASAGGIEALQRFFEALPEEPGMAFVVVTHRPPDQSSELAAMLQPHAALPVAEVTEATEVSKNHVYVAPPGRALTLEGLTLQPVAFDASGEQRAPINRFFRSLARSGAHPVGVVLSGSGSDGAVGLRAIEEAGGLTAVQDPEEAAYDSMPRSAIEASRIDVIQPAGPLAGRLVAYGETTGAAEPAGDPGDLGGGGEEALRDIFAQVRARTGHDFSDYKRSTMLRRIRRRLRIGRMRTLPEYADFLHDRPAEVQELQKDLLVGLSSFFRDLEAFEALRNDLLPALFARKDPDEEIRAWVPGCATGEEAYSLAMLLLERAEKEGVPPDRIQIFASDLDEDALATAREGRYPGSVAADIPERYHGRYVARDGTHMAVKLGARDRIIFAAHDLLSDPPFSNLDLISCRNVLIYLKRELQASVFELFSYALNEEGLLFLGSSESPEPDPTDSFQAARSDHRIYQRAAKGHPAPNLPSMPLAAQPPRRTEIREKGGSDSEPPPSAEEIHRRLLEAHAPPSALVAEDYTFVHLSPEAGRYLLHPAGTPNTNIVEVVRPELQVRLQAALRDAFARGRATRTTPVEVEMEGSAPHVRLAVHPAGEAPGAGPGQMALVMFIETSKELIRRGGPGEREDGSAEGESSGEDTEAQRLREELRQTKDRLRATVEKHESSKQEMRAANEELRSMNEEYQSTAEELETSQEELRSANEELKTVNRKLEAKVEALREANSALKNLMVATDIGTLFLDRELKVRRFTPPIEELFSVQPGDQGRPISDFTHQLEYDRLEADARQVLEELAPVEREVRGSEDRWFLARTHPYRTVEDVIDGVVLTFVDITRRKQAEEELRATIARLKQRTEQVRALSSALTTAEEKERRRISEILHEDLQQLLYAAQLNVQTAEKEGGESLPKLTENIEQAIETTRSLASQLNPPLSAESMRDLLEWLAMHMQEAQGLSVALDIEPPGAPIDQNLRVLLFRIAQELLFNVVKHAGVREARLAFAESERGARVIVADEGCGFDPEEQLAGSDLEGGLGLTHIRDRAEMIGGKVDVEAAPGEGARVTVDVPGSTSVDLEGLELTS